MTARLRRGSGARSRRAAKGAAPKKIAKRLPGDQARITRWAGLVFALFMALIAAVVLVALNVPGRVTTGIGEAIGRAGFAVKRVDVVGIRNMDSAPVYEVALGQKSRAMPLVDVGEIRRELLQYGWVKDARVSRRLPDTLVVDIVERTPVALWQDRDRLALIDSDGVVIDRVQVTRMPDLPLLIGPGANRRGKELDRLLDAAPSLKPQLLSAAWVGGRRWDLALQTGETIALPEGEEEASAALGKFADIDKSTGLLGRGLLRFDLRLPGKMVVRLPRAPGEAAPAPPTEG
ncbi:MAG TPA: cell division protein FtsQ/DivIB [Sphingomicrobium sp.]|nr:cell division protein FtsQ/DivIB [Sphingomicrobium sp.]